MSCQKDEADNFSGFKQNETIQTRGAFAHGENLILSGEFEDYFCTNGLMQ